MKLSHKIFSMLMTTCFLSCAVNASENQGANVISVNGSNQSVKAVSNGGNSNPFKADTSTNGRVYVAAGGGGGAFPPDPSLASTDVFCFLGFCITTNKK